MVGTNPIHHFLWQEQIESISFGGTLRCFMFPTSPISHLRHQHISSNLSRLDSLLPFRLPFRINLIMVQTLITLITPKATPTKGYVTQKSVLKGALICLTKALSLNFNSTLSPPSKQKKKQIPNMGQPPTMEPITNQYPPAPPQSILLVPLVP